MLLVCRLFMCVRCSVVIILLNMLSWSWFVVLLLMCIGSEFW